VRDCLSTCKALASDYDNTLARQGRVDASVAEALARFRQSGRKLILVTGRELPDLLAIFPEIKRFDRVVAENGAVMYRPGDGTAEALGDPPSVDLLEALHRKGVTPLAVGRVILATSRRQARLAEAVIDRHKLGYHIVFNKGSAMVLPSGIDKGTGLLRALDELGLSAAETFGIGDAENDREFLSLCGCAAVVANALPTLKRTVPLVTHDSYGAGVVEIISRILANNLPKAARTRARQRT
jgi:hydroxymethylpyrimidine pyrophosphatase-like HAD family hydrolase